MQAEWGDVRDAWEPEPVRAAPSGAVFGYIYETIERGQRDGEHRYVGKTEQTIHERAHGRAGHTSKASVAKDPWKANILPGRRGYRCLEVVRDTGEGYQANKRALARAEAFWIDRLRPARNKVRPVRPPSNVPEPAPVAERAPLPLPRMSGRRVVFLLLAAGWTWLLAVPLSAAHLPALVPWIACPLLGLMLSWKVMSAVTKRTDRARRRVRRVLG
jgi:hypothetical protein